jgi:hypothetical protein
LFLICDVHPAHRTELVKALAAELNIALLYIPPWAMDQLQRLDRVVLGVLEKKLVDYSAGALDMTWHWSGRKVIPAWI